MVLILTDDLDFHTDLVIEMLRHKRAKYCRFETHRVPGEIGLTVTAHSTQRAERLTIAGMPVWLDQVASVWYRRPAAAWLPPDVGEEVAKVISSETFHAIDGLYGRLADRFWVNWAPNDRLAHHKPYQLKVAAEAGLQIPDTLITNEPQELRLFFEEHNGEVIYKPMHGFVRNRMNVSYGVYTTVVTRRDIEERSESVSHAPCLFQRLIPKRVEYRITIMGEDVFPVAIESQVHEKTKVDWRRSGNAWREMRHKPESLPDQVVQSLRDLMARLGLVFGTIDMIVTPEGQHVFLEINPAGQWYWLELATGVPLLDTFTDLLIRGTRAPRSLAPALQGRPSVAPQ